MFYRHDVTIVYDGIEHFWCQPIPSEICFACIMQILSVTTTRDTSIPNNPRLNVIKAFSLTGKIFKAFTRKRPRLLKLELLYYAMNYSIHIHIFPSWFRKKGMIWLYTFKYSILLAPLWPMDTTILGTGLLASLVT